MQNLLGFTPRMTMANQGGQKDSKFIAKDVLSSMPDNVITDILNRLPIQDAVKTSVLSRNWRFNWIMLTVLVFDMEFFKHLEEIEQCSCLFWKIINRILLHVKGDITRFHLFVPHWVELDSADVSYLILFLSSKRMKEFTLINLQETQLELPTHLSSCLNLTYLELRNCCIHLAPGFSGFLELKSLEFYKVKFEKYTVGEFIDGCPSLENLEVGEFSVADKLKPFHFAKLHNLKRLELALCNLDTISVTGSDILCLLSSLLKLEDLCLNFHACKFLAENSAGKRVSTTFGSLKILRLVGIDFNNSAMASCVFDLLHCFPNLQKLRITAATTHVVSPPLSAEYGMMKQLESVSLVLFTDSKNEISLIKFLLAYSPCLKKMKIVHKCHDVHEAFMFSTKLLKLHRASNIVDISLFKLTCP